MSQLLPSGDRPEELEHDLQALALLELKSKLNHIDKGSLRSHSSGLNRVRAAFQKELRTKLSSHRWRQRFNMRESICNASRIRRTPFHNVELVFGEHLGETVRLLDSLGDRLRVFTLDVAKSAGVENGGAHAQFFRALGLPNSWVFHVSIITSAVIVLGYIYLGGLTSAIYNEVIQFFLIVAGFFPLVFLGLVNVGGWRGLTQKLPPAYVHAWHGMDNPQHNLLGVDWFGLVMGLGFVPSFGYWCTDFLVIQRAMAADSMASARRVPLIASVPKMLFPFLVILPDLIALALTSPVAQNAASPDQPMQSPQALEDPVGPKRPDPTTNEPGDGAGSQG